MISYIRNLLDRQPIPHKGGPLLPEPSSALVRPGPRSGGPRNTQTYTKVFRYRLPDGHTNEPKSVEIVGSFTHWQRVPLQRDGKIDCWHTTIHHIPGNRTHHYMMLVDGVPTYDKTCDGFAPPHGHAEEQYQLATEQGPRVLMLFAQTK